MRKKQENMRRWLQIMVLRAGFQLKCIVAEVGCRGYIPPSFRKALQHFGFTSKELKKLVDECSLVSRISSYYIWLNRFHQSFIPLQMVPTDTAAYKSIAVVWFFCRRSFFLIIIFFLAGIFGYIPPSFRKALQHFGFTSKELKTLVDECSLVSS